VINVSHGRRVWIVLARTGFSYRSAGFGAGRLMTSIPMRSLLWAPTIAMSWLWGLGFFYAIHVTLAHGWLGFLSFAGVNCLGLFLFGFALGAPGVDPEARLKSAAGPFNALFLMSQTLAVAITIFGLVAYVFAPLGLPAGASVAAAAIIVLVACAVGQGVKLTSLAVLHVGVLVAGLVCGVGALALLSAPGQGGAPLLALDERFVGMMVPSLVGFLLGPWTDLQQWRRAAEIRRAGLSPRIAYAGGAALFFGLLCLNAAIAAAVGTGFAQTAADGIAGHQGAPAAALAALKSPLAVALYVAWAALAAIATIDSAYEAIGWHLRGVVARSASPLLGIVPAGLITSPLWVIALAAWIAASLHSLGLSQLYLMAPYATLLVGSALALAVTTLKPGAKHDGMLALLIGAAALLLFVAGYLAGSGVLLTLSTVVATIGGWSALAVWFGRAPVPEAAPAPAAPTPEPAPAAARAMPQLGDSFVYHGFDDKWFVLHLKPTYDDTNSVGNIYFANYIRWVGKARELFFNHCMPNFDLKTTPFYILTHSLKHDFRREAKEFEPITVKIRISAYNRKFVELEHEIYSDVQGLLGRGVQSLMFADSTTYALVDFPRPVIEGFLPFLPKMPPASLYAPEAPDMAPAPVK
jgi:acyl-CoA thioesterase FadM